MVQPFGDFRPLPALLLSTALLGGCRGPATETTEPVQVAAAADLSVAFEELGALFEAHTQNKITFSFGASGALANQVAAGAPFDLFAAASASAVASAVNAGACDASTKALYARGSLVAWSRPGGVRLHSLAELSDATVQRIAIANPEHAPYGKAAREALTRAGLWPSLERKIVLAENVRQALQFAQTGNADVALVALSLVAQSSAGSLLRVEASLHEPIEQLLVVCRHGKNSAGARAFAKLVTSPDGQALLARHGFGVSSKPIGQ